MVDLGLTQVLNFEFKGRLFHLREESRSMLPIYMSQEHESKLICVRLLYQRRCETLKKSLKIYFLKIEETIKKEPDMINFKRV